MSRYLLPGLAVLAIVGLLLAGKLTCTRERPPVPDAAVAPADSAARRPRSTTTLALRVTDGGAPVAARVLLSANQAPVRIGTLDLYQERQGGAACEIAPNVVGTWDGLILGRGVVEVPIGADTCVPSPAIPYGVYDVLAWRGVEYELWRGKVDLSANRGRVELAIPLERAWTPHGTLAADLHVHAKASPDSTTPNPQRVIAQAAAGIQVIALSDHNSNGDLADDIAALELADIVTSIPSNELSSDLLHAGLYPVQVLKDIKGGGSPDTDTLNAMPADEFLKVARKIAGTGIVQLNHPRMRSTALFDATGWDGVKWPPPFPLAFDAVELINGLTNYNYRKDRRLDESVRDFYTFVDHGFLVAPLGNSDTHDFNWILDGSARTYVYVDSTKTSPFDEAAFVGAIRRRRVVATTGPWLDVEVSAAKGATSVGPGQVLQAKGSVWVDVTVERTRFVHVERVRITTGADKPQLVQTIDIPKDQRVFRWSGRIAIGKRDTWIGITVDGDNVLPLEVTGSYHWDRKRLGVTPFAIASPILVDADGDGRWRRGRADVPVQ